MEGTATVLLEIVSLERDEGTDNVLVTASNAATMQTWHTWTVTEDKARELYVGQPIEVSRVVEIELPI